MGEKVAPRYKVITPNIWLETQPALFPEIPPEPPEIIVPYLKLYLRALLNQGMISLHFQRFLNGFKP
ncbi:hypothetical protein RintRC_0663 [Richelia intracellularis]|nr:hypothetical protein RintRC_0663 [Richelia intracellularis]